MTEAVSNGSRLRAVRAELGLAVDDAARRLEIRSDVLQHLEDGGWLGDDELRTLVARLRQAPAEPGPRRIGDLLPTVQAAVAGGWSGGSETVLDFEAYLAANRDSIAQRSAEIRRAEAEEEERRRRSAFLEAEARVPKKFHGRLLDARPTAATVAVAELAEGGAGILVLLGPHGVGKSFGGALACVHRRGDWVPMGRLLELWTSDARRRLCSSSLLVLDEIGREGGSLRSRAAAADAVEELAHLAGEDGRSIILTSNQTLDSLRGWIETQREDATGAERWTRFSCRLEEHGVRPRLAELRRLGGQVLRDGVVWCPALPREAL